MVGRKSWDESYSEKVVLAKERDLNACHDVPFFPLDLVLFCVAFKVWQKKMKNGLKI